MSDLSLREKFEAVIQKGREAEIALGKLSTLEVAESTEASIADLRAAVEIAEAEGDFQTSSKLKERWIGLLRGGAR